jgi:type VI secretion system protein ImpH
VTTGEFSEPSRLIRTIVRAEAASPLAELARHPYWFDFFQAVRLIALAATDSLRSRRDVSPRAMQPYEEHIRFRTHVGQAFPASTIASFTASADTAQAETGPSCPEMSVTFFGLAGTGGILPAHYTQLLIDRMREKDLGLRDFLDLFNHRLIAQFYRAWEKCHFFVGYEGFRRAGREQTDRFTRMLFGLVGMETAGLRGRQAIDDEALLYYTGHFAHRPRSAVALAQIIGDFFQVPTTIEQFQGQWMYLRPADWTRLTVGGNNQLGVSAVTGRRVWGIENKIRVRLRIFRYDIFRTFMPGASAYAAIGQIVRLFLGPAFDFDLQLVLSRESVPRCQLVTGGGVQLGWNTWLFSGAAASRDVDDAVFACEGMPRV